MNEQQKEQIIDALSTAYSDPEVKKDPHMHQVLLDSAKQLTKDSELSNGICPTQ